MQAPTQSNLSSNNEQNDVEILLGNIEYCIKAVEVMKYRMLQTLLLPQYILEILRIGGEIY